MEGVLVPEVDAPMNKKKEVKAKYDYNKHLRPTGVPGSIFVSKDGKVSKVGEPERTNFSKGLNLDPQLFPWTSKDAEEEAAYYKKMEIFNADQIIDPEIDKVLNIEDDDDELFNEENALDDDFVLKANMDDDDEYDPDGYVDDDLSDYGGYDDVDDGFDVDDDMDDYDDDDDDEMGKRFKKLSLDHKGEGVIKDFEKDIMAVPGRPVHSLFLEEKFEVVCTFPNPSTYQTD